MTDYDIKPSDIVKPSSDELIDDFKNIGAVFSLFKDLDFSSIDELANFQDPEFIKNIRGLGYLWNEDCNENYEA